MNLVLPDNLANQAVMKNPPALAQFAPLNVAELSGAIVAGDPIAFEEFYRRYAPRVYGLLMALTSANDDLARDLLQGVMLRAARKFKSAATDDALWAWLATITRNALIDHIRSDQRRWRREQSAVAFPSAPDPPGVSEELTEALEQALTELDPNDQALIRDFYFNAQSQADIAAGNEITVKAVQSRLARIRRRIKEILTCKLNHES
jgi:RNA polymerase sigma-70 factor, ECF subfamily